MQSDLRLKILKLVAVQLANLKIPLFRVKIKAEQHPAEHGDVMLYSELLVSPFMNVDILDIKSINLFLSSVVCNNAQDNNVSETIAPK